MLQTSRTRVFNTTQRPANAVGSIKEGMALVTQLASGAAAVAAAGGHTYESFYGVALSPPRIDTVGVMSQQLIPTASSLTVPLIRQSVSGSVGIIRDDGTMLAMTASSANSKPTPAAGNVVIWTPGPGATPVGDSTVDYVIFAADDVTAALALGFNWTAMYRYVYLPVDIASLIGNPLSPGVSAESWINSVAVLRSGYACTDCFCPDEAWSSLATDTGSANGHLKVVAGGLFAPYGSSKAGFVIPMGFASIYQIPTPSDPWLQIEIGL